MCEKNFILRFLHCFLLLFLVLAGCHSEAFAEALAEIAGVGEPTVEGDILNGQVGRLQ
jgi:hypothetical protein